MIATIQWNDRVRRRLKLRDVDILLAVIQAGSMGKAAEVNRAGFVGGSRS
jgi:hypothetical protein